MTEDPSQTPSNRSLPVRFSLGTLLLVVTIVGLATALMLEHRRLSQIERQLAETQQELSTLQPLSAEEVARQFENATTLGPISTTVQDVRYSPTEDAYQVEFAWMNEKKNKERWSSQVKLTSDGYGRYFGRIRSDAFTQPLGHKDGFTVAVETPSPLAE